MKIYKIWAKIEDLFAGNSELFIKVTKETKNRIHGYEVLNWTGECDYSFETPILGNEPITFIKDNLTGYKEVKEDRKKLKKG